MKAISSFQHVELDAIAMGPAVRQKFASSGEIPKAFSGIGEGMGSRPVFKLTFYDGEVLIVKAEGRTEAGAKDSISLGGKLMALMSNASASEIISDGEWGELYSIANRKETLDHYYLLDIMRAMYNGGYMFVFHKMAFIDNLRDAEGLQEAGKGHKVLTKLKEGDACVTLGKILACDRFMSNNDRFNKDGGIVNKGNIIFQKQADSTYVPLGLDFYQACVDASNMTKPPPNDNWGGMVLLNDAAMSEYATACIDSLNDEFGQDVAWENKMAPAHAHKIHRGMKEGRDALRDHLKRNQARLPDGAIERMKKLKWRASFTIGGTRG